MRRVLVIGICGAGKSTFSQVLAARTGLPLIHLDKEFWRPGWTETPRPEWRTRVAELVADERWIMDGNYAGSLDLRLPRADSVVWFDYPTVRSMRRVLWRIATTHGGVRSDMAPGCPEQLDPGFLHYIWTFNARKRPLIVAALTEFGRHVEPLVFHRDREVRQFLEQLS